MKFLPFILLVLGVTSGCRIHSPSDHIKHGATAPSHDIYRKTGGVEVTCTPSYYRCVGDYDSMVLIPAKNAAFSDDSRATGVVLMIKSPESEAGKILSFHFDFPEKWNHWYKPDVLYKGMINTNLIGKMSFSCDPGLREMESNLKTTGKP